MAQESTLRQAINKITDWPAASATTTPVPRAQSAGAPGTTVALANEVAALPPDPFAAELATLQASNADLAAQIAGMTTTTPTATAATTTPPAATEPPAFVPLEDFNNLQTTRYGADPELHKEAMATGQILTKPYMKTDDYGGWFDWSADAWYQLEQKNARAYEEYLADPWGGKTPEEVGAEVAAADAAAATTAAAVAAQPLKAPVNPGPRAPWQQSQQYWKDLEAYRAAAGTGI